MPYMRSGKCVYKKKPDGSRGKKKGCSDNEKAAEKYMSKLYSVEEMVKKELSNFLAEEDT